MGVGRLFPTFLGIGLPTMMQVGPDDAILNFCKWPRKFAPSLSEACLPTWVTADHIYSLAVMLIAGGVVWASWPYLSEGSARKKMVLGFTILFCSVGTAIIALSLIAAGEKSPQQKAETAGLPGGGEAEGIRKLTDRELLDYTVRFASDMRTFEANSDVERAKAGEFVSSNMTQDQRIAIYASNAAKSAEQNARYRQQFQNLYLHTANQLRDEIKARLNKRGMIVSDTYSIKIFGSPMEIELLAFEGHLTGPHPISNAANYLEQIARRLVEREN
jgi:hypothetical protein